MTRHARRGTGVIGELAQRVRGVAREEIVANGTSLERFTVVGLAPLVIEEIEGELRLEDGDPDFTIGDVLRHHISIVGIKLGDQMLVVRAGGEWHAIDNVGV